MKTTLITILTALAFAGSVEVAAAQEDDDELEATIRLMGADEAELPEAVTREIVLPPSVSEDAAAVEAAAKGLETANEARSRGDEAPGQGGQGDRGQDIADEARSGNPGAEARENAADMADAAREHAENRSRGRNSRPDPPDPPGPPELPDPPNPGGQS